MLLMPQVLRATIEPTAIYTDSIGQEVRQTGNFTAEAPLHVRFVANASALDAGASLEWHFEHTGPNGTTSLTRYGDETEYDFTESGKTVVTLRVVVDDDVVESADIIVTISESVLNMPNAFSPNNDGVNDFYQAKSSSKSIVSFRAFIFNRWGQKLYEWTNWRDETKGWDGKFHGKPVKDGVYFVLVNARGADGRKYEIRRDITLLRRHNNETSTASGQ